MSYEQQLEEAYISLLQHSTLEPYVKVIGPPIIELRVNYFETLIGSIISQQLSTKATSTIRGRMVDLLGGSIDQEQIKQTATADLKSVGLSINKATYIKRLAEDYLDEDFDSIHQLGDQEVIKKLVSFSGIGEWTAQMFMMFSLGRLDVWPIKDVGLQNGIKKIFELDTLTEPELDNIGVQFKPYRSIATWYAWRATDSELKL